MPDESEFICGDWVWDPVVREMRHFPRRKKGHAEEPDAVERLESASKISLHFWSQQPIQTATGEVMSAQQARVVVEYADGRRLDINEDDRACAVKLAEAIAQTYGLPVVRAGSPTGVRGGNLPSRDQMGRLVNKSGRVEVVLDESAGVLQIMRSKRPFGKSRREVRTTEVRRVELVTHTRGPMETISVNAIVGVEDEPVPVASYSAMEGWTDLEEWREFTRDLAARLGVEARTG